MVTFKIDWYHGCDGIRTPGVTIVNARSMMAVFTFPPSSPHFGLPRTLGPLAAWVPPPSLFPHSSLKIDVCILWNLHNRSDTLDTFKLLVPPWWSGWIRMSYDWLCMNLPELTSQVKSAQVKSAQNNMLLPPGYLYPDLDGCIICYFVLQPPYRRGNAGWGVSAGKHVVTLHGIDLRSAQPCYMSEIQLGFHSTHLSSTIGF